MVHQIRQRRIDRAGLRAPVRRERGLEHEDVLLPAGWLQFRPVVDSVEQHVFRPSDLAGGPRGVPKPPWLITCRPAGGRTRAPRASHTASFIKLGSQKKNLHGEGGGKGNVAPCISDVCAERLGLSIAGGYHGETSIVVLWSFNPSVGKPNKKFTALSFIMEHILLLATIDARFLLSDIGYSESV